MIVIRILFHKKLPQGFPWGRTVIYRVGHSFLRKEAYLHRASNASRTNWTLGPMMT